LRLQHDGNPATGYSATLPDVHSHTRPFLYVYMLNFHFNFVFISAHKLRWANGEWGRPKIEESATSLQQHMFRGARGLCPGTRIPTAANQFNSSHIQDNAIFRQLRGELRVPFENLKKNYVLRKKLRFLSSENRIIQILGISACYLALK